MRKIKFEQFENVWDALADSPEEAANLTLRSDLMMKIEAIVKKNGWTQAEAAIAIGLSLPGEHTNRQDQLESLRITTRRP